MKKVYISLVALAFAGCSSGTFYNTHNSGDTGVLSVTAYTSDGCLKKLMQRADDMGVKVTLTKVRSQLVGYKCSGTTERF